MGWGGRGMLNDGWSICQPAAGVGFLRGHGRALEGIRRRRQLRAPGLDGQRRRRLATRLDLAPRSLDPVVEGIGFLEARAVLLDPPPPDVVVRIEIQRLLPRLDRALEVVDAPAL